MSKKINPTQDPTWIALKIHQRARILSALAAHGAAIHSITVKGFDADIMATNGQRYVVRKFSMAGPVAVLMPVESKPLSAREISKRGIAAKRQHELDEAATRMVRNEVHLCLSGVVYGLTRNDRTAGDGTVIPHGLTDEDVINLWSPVYESEEDEEQNPMEVFEHWAVSDWLAEQLTAHHERVVEFFDLMVWCRTCTGQGISSDGVIQTIAGKMMAD